MVGDDLRFRKGPRPERCIQPPQSDVQHRSDQGRRRLRIGPGFSGADVDHQPQFARPHQLFMSGPVERQRETEIVPTLLDEAVALVCGREGRVSPES